MPANTDLSQLKTFVKQMQENMNSGWWNHIDHAHMQWTAEELAAATSGLFYMAAQTEKVIYHHLVNQYSFKLPENCDNIKETSRKLSVEFVNNLENEIKLRLIKSFVPSSGKRVTLNNVYYNSESICSLDIAEQLDGTHKVSIDVDSFDKKLVEKIVKLVEKYLMREAAEPELFAVVETNDGLNLVSIGKPGTPLERVNYSDKVLNSYDYVVKELNSSKPFGRLVIMHGSPGSGKTYALRGLFNDLDNNSKKFIFLQPEFLIRHSAAALMQLLLKGTAEGDSLILIMEDADDCLVPRQADNMAAITTLLNLADGFIGQMLDIRIIATTNARKLDIDSALKRPGRLCDIIEVDALSPEKAAEIIKHHSGKDVEVSSKMTLAEVYAEINRQLGHEIRYEQEEKKPGFIKQPT